VEKSDIHPVDRFVGHRLRLARTSRKLSQTQLGEASGITFQQVQKYEKGTNRVSASRLYEFATLLGVEISYFFEGAGGGVDTLSAVPAPKFDVSQVDVDILRALWSIKDPQLKRKLLALITSLPSEGEMAMPHGHRDGTQHDHA
jgi:transcriptional regulator with XRE-family HTH domain